MKKFFIFFIFPYLLFSMTLQSYFFQAEEGDFIVTEQSKTSTIIFIRKNLADKMLIEEVSIPSHLYKDKSFRTWYEKKAPGHTSWSLLVLDKEKCMASYCYSYAKKEAYHIDGSCSFLTKLLQQKLTPLDASERKKIGPPPLSGEEDRRSLWQPEMTFEGKKINKPIFHVYRSTWQDDGSDFAGITFDLYFSEKPKVIFPICIYIQSEHFRMTLRCIDAGKNLKPCKKLPSALHQSF